MITLLSLIDLAVLVLLVVHLLRAVGDFGSPALSAVVGLFVILFAIVSVGAFGGLIGGSSMAMQVVVLLVLLVMAFLVLSSWKRSARPA